MKKKQMISASLFYNYSQCPTRVYLNMFQDRSKRLVMSNFMQKKMEDGLLHEKMVIKNEEFVEVPEINETEAYANTLELMRKGTVMIYQGVLIKDDMIGRPDILLKIKGASNLGDHHYMACDIKSGKRLKEEYRLQVTFYSHLLELVQNRLPEKGRIINSARKNLDFRIKDEIDRFYDVMRKVREISKGIEVKPSITSRCGDCRWKEVCFEQAEKDGDISLIYKMNRKQKELLNNNHITTLKHAAQIDVYSISDITGISRSAIRRFGLQARSLLNSKHIVIDMPHLPIHSTEIFFDIEGESELGIDYLYGVLLRKDGKEEYKSFWADTPKDEKKMWNEFCDFMSSVGDCRIYHYTGYEKISINRLKKKYGIDNKLEKLFNCCTIDLFPQVTNNVILPIYSYSIKPIAKLLGFKWSDKNAGGTQSMVWYEAWLNKNEQSVKEKILEYNMNDCQATRVVLDWLRSLKFDTVNNPKEGDVCLFR